MVFDAVRFKSEIMAEVNARIVAANSVLSQEFQKKFAELTASSIANAHGGIDPERVPVTDDQAAWSGDPREGQKLFRWARRAGDSGPPVLIAMDPPPFPFENTEEWLDRKFAWLQKALPVQAAGNRSRDQLSGESHSQNMADWRQAKEAQYRNITSYPPPIAVPENAPGNPGSIGGIGNA